MALPKNSLILALVYNKIFTLKLIAIEGQGKHYHAFGQTLTAIKQKDKVDKNKKTENILDLLC